MVVILACKNIQVLLACRWHVFAGRKNEDRLAAAYDSFHNWCVAERKNPPWRNLSWRRSKCLRALALKSCMFVHACMTMFLFEGIYMWHLNFTLTCVGAAEPRLQCWPGGCGKAHDTTVLCQWMLSVVTSQLRDGHDSELKNTHEWKQTVDVAVSVLFCHALTSNPTLRKLRLMVWHFYAGRCKLWIGISRL